MHALKLGLVGHRYHLAEDQRGFYDALGRAADVATHFVDDGWPSSLDDLGDLRETDAIIWYVRFRELETAPAFDWAGFDGLRVMYDEDVNQNFHGLGGTRYLGAWPGVFRRHRFDLLVCTGREARDRMIDEGIDAHWMPKAFDPERLRDLGGPRRGICFFGSRYLSRRAMLTALSRGGIPVESFSCAPPELGEHLNRHLAGLICNYAARPRLPVPRRLHARLPPAMVVVQDGFEPMKKNFEIAAAGCAPIADRIPELTELGFVDGETMVAYDDFADLVDRCRYYLSEPDGLRRIGKHAAEMVHARHTYDHRARDLCAGLARRISR